MTMAKGAEDGASVAKKELGAGVLSKAGLPLGALGNWTVVGEPVVSAAFDGSHVGFCGEE